MYIKKRKEKKYQYGDEMSRGDGDEVVVGPSDGVWIGGRTQ